MEFSPLSHLAIVFCLSAPFWHIALICRAAEHSIWRTICLLSCAAAAIVYCWFSVLTRFDTSWLGPAAAARPLLYLAIAAGLAFWGRYWILGTGVSQHLLIGLQLIRPVGMVFVLETTRGTIPPIFAHPAGWGDLAVGLTAAYVLYRYRRQAIPERWVLIVAILGLADFASAFFFGFTTADTPVQLFSHDAPNRVLNYPLGLIPLLLVPYAVVAHILSLAQLKKDREKAEIATKA